MSSPRLAVVIPAGPRDDVLDTVHSVLHYIPDAVRIVIVDDTAGGRPGDLAALRAMGPPVTVIDAPDDAPGAQGGLWLKLAAGMKHALARAEFDLLLRLDADALVLGRGVAEAAARRFSEDDRLGLIGSYRIDPVGRIRGWTVGGRILQTEAGLRGLRHPALRRTLRRLLGYAAVHGYVPGEHPLGGAYLFRAETVRALADRGWFDLSELVPSNAGEDHLYGLLTVAAGFRIGDFGGPDQPLSLRWKGLPKAPADLVREGKLITHSVRYWQDMREPEIRRYFAERRAAESL